MATTGLWKKHCLIAVCRKEQAHRGSLGRGRAPAEADHCFSDAVQSLLLRAWQPMIRRFRDGHIERCWAAFTNAHQPAELAALLGTLKAGHGINPYLRL